MTYEAWRCTFQSAEAAARAAYGQVQGAVAEAAGLREKLEARCPGLVQIQEPAETAAPVVLPEPVTWLVERSAFRVSPHGQDAESCEWLEEAHEPGEKGSFAVYTGPQVRALLAATCSLVQEVYVEFIKDGMGGDFEDGEHPLADRVRAFLAGAAVPAAPEHPAQGVPAPAVTPAPAAVAVADALRDVIEAIEYTPLGVRALQALKRARAALAATPATTDEPPFLQRLRTEQRDLSERHQKLSAFIVAPAFQMLTDDDKGLLRKQEAQQHVLLQTLNQRIHGASGKHVREKHNG